MRSATSVKVFVIPSYTELLDEDTIDQDDNHADSTCARTQRKNVRHLNWKPDDFDS